MNWYLKYALLSLVGWGIVLAVVLLLAAYMTPDECPLVNNAIVDQTGHRIHL